MYRYEIVIEDDFGYYYLYTVVAENEEQAKEEVEEQAIWMDGIEPVKLVDIEEFDELIDSCELCNHTFDDSSEMPRLIETIFNDLECLVINDISIYDYVRECVNNISCLIDYAYCYLHREVVRNFERRRDDLTFTLQLIFQGIDTLCEFVNRHELSGVINAVNKIYVNYAAKIVYNYN